MLNAAQLGHAACDRMKGMLLAAAGETSAAGWKRAFCNGRGVRGAGVRQNVVKQPVRGPRTGQPARNRNNVRVQLQSWKTGYGGRQQAQAVAGGGVAVSGATMQVNGPVVAGR